MDKTMVTVTVYLLLYTKFYMSTVRSEVVNLIVMLSYSFHYMIPVIV